MGLTECKLWACRLTLKYPFGAAGGHGRAARKRCDASYGEYLWIVGNQLVYIANYPNSIVIFGAYEQSYVARAH